MLDCTVKEFMNGIFSMNDGDMNKNSSKCDNDLASRTSQFSKDKADIPIMIERSAKGFNLAEEKLYEKNKIFKGLSKKIWDYKKRREEEEELQLCSKSFSSAVTYNSAATTDDEYKYVPKSQTNLKHLTTDSSHVLITKKSSSDEEVASSQRVKKEIPVRGSKSERSNNGSMSSFLTLDKNASALEQELVSCLAYDTDDERESMDTPTVPSNIALRQKLPSHPELNTLQEIAFIEWNVFQNELLKRRGRCVL